MCKDFIDGLVSVIVPVYNAERYIRETLDSIIGQTYKNIEVICVDDMSNDSSREIIKEYESKYSNIKSILLSENAGVANARNVGIENARGRYIAFLDSDDLWLQDKIDKQIDFMIKNGYCFTFTGYRFIDSESQKLNTIVHAKSELAYEDMLRHNAISCLTVVIDRYIVKEIRMKKIHHEDYVAWLDILKQGHKAHGLDELLALYRTRRGSLSGNKLRAACWTWNILRNEEKLGFIKALYYFSNYAVINVYKHFLSK
ncbi:glycosyltransferase family 2 protein [Peptostreptococcus sp. D1]|uniref:glycosyltransferase family 2 protein n=1 Tax=Peptostreptococcus sp. D1 TaxID=72304 RepID=UPI0008E384B1|nr:glycosyltransferase family 2 protein [Peptostreptococcus sp. D1]SFE18884.1 Glycosyltransferase involved in cell wall bisynthesis [Peptostreptococcus sp. D1]